MQSLSLGQVVWKGLSYQRWMQIPIALGVAAATAVIVGAMVVGDSVRSSLKNLTLDRLGKVDQVLVAPRFFDESTVAEWKVALGNTGKGNLVEGLILFPRSTVETKFGDSSSNQSSTPADNTDRFRIAGGVLCLGIDSHFWTLGDIASVPRIGNDEAVMNAALADELAVSVGDRISIRLPSLQAVPADSPLGKRDDSTVSLPNLRIVAILPNQSIARFDLRSNQRPARNVFVAKSAIQQLLDRPQQINAAFISSASSNSVKEKFASSNSSLAAAVDESKAMLKQLPVKLNDLGYSIKPIRETFDGKPIIDYVQITSDQLLIPSHALNEIEASIPRRNPKSNKLQRASLLAYLANAISKVDSIGNPITDETTSSAVNTVVPYSTIVGIEPDSIDAPTIGFDASGSIEDLKRWSEGLARGELLITNWLAKQIDSREGDSLRIDYYLPETIDGTEVEKSVVMKIAGVVPITEPSSGYRRNRPARFDSPPTQFNDPEMVPKVPGITDQDSMSDWDLPFALTRKIRPEDDEFWSQHRLTPKLYMSLEASQKLFGSRFGSVSSVRVAVPEAASLQEPTSINNATEVKPTESNEIDELQSKLLANLRSNLPDLGWQMLPLRAQQIAASKGTTPFDALFMALSMFVIVSALLLVSLLFRLSIERRATEWGLLKSIGFPPARIQSILRLEGILLSGAGSIIGVLLGIAYGYLVIGLLKSWWIGAVGSPFLDFHVTLQSLLIGCFIGIVMAWLTIFVSSRMLNRLSAIRLLKGNVADSNSSEPKPVNVVTNWFAITIQRVWFRRVFWLTPIAVLFIGLGQTGPAAAGAFVGAGMLILFGLVVWSYQLIRQRRTSSSSHWKPMTLLSLASNSVRRNPWRSVMAVGLMAVASFLILSISLFEASPDDAGTGGFDLLVQSTVSIPKNLSDKSYQRETLGNIAEVLTDVTIIPMRVRDGDDAGCSNLYQAAQPQVLGVSSQLRIWSDDLPLKSSTETATATSNDRSSYPDFAWAAKGNVRSGESPWVLLEELHDGTAESPVPVILDQNTALWALHLSGTLGEVFHYELGNQTVYFKTAAVLQNTVLQGSLLIGESNFQKLFPEISGYRTWLVRDDSKTHDLSVSQRTARTENIANTLERGWSDEGMDAATTSSILRNLLAVQNTYLNAFQSLGGLGLLLGTFGLAVVQMRSIQERRAELGLMKAIGWSKSRLAKLLLFESLVLLGWGIGIGIIAAFFAILPTLIQGAIPIGVLSPFITLVLIAVFGLISASIAVRLGVNVPMLKSLRSE